MLQIPGAVLYGPDFSALPGFFWLFCRAFFMDLQEIRQFSLLFAQTDGAEDGVHCYI